MSTDAFTPAAGFATAAVHPRRARTLGQLAALAAAGERAFAFLALVVLSGAFLPLLSSAAAGSPEDLPASPARAALLLAVYAGTLLAVARRPGEVLRAALRNPLVPALVALAAASYLWSEAPGLTLRRAAALGMTTLFGAWLAARFSRRQVLGLLAAALGTAAVLSLAAGVLWPEVGRDPEFDGAWRGVFAHKNVMGKAMVLAALVVLVRAGGPARPGRTLESLLLLPAIALVLLSRSALALVALPAVLLLVPVMRALARRNVLVLLAAPAAVCVAALVAGGTGAGPTAVAAALGRDATLTGRTELWEAVLASIGKRTGLGYGYGAFWHTSAESESVFAAIGWAAWHAHNAFLDVWLHLGVVGLLLLVAAIGWAAVRAVRELRAGEGAEAVWPLAFLAFLVVTNLTESRILEPNTLYWALFAAVSCAPATVAAARPLPARQADPFDAPPPGAEADGPAGPVSPGVRRRWRWLAASRPRHRASPLG